MRLTHVSSIFSFSFFPLCVVQEIQRDSHMPRGCHTLCTLRWLFADLNLMAKHWLGAHLTYSYIVPPAMNSMARPKWVRVRNTWRRRISAAAKIHFCCQCLHLGNSNLAEHLHSWLCCATTLPQWWLIYLLTSRKWTTWGWLKEECAKTCVRRYISGSWTDLSDKQSGVDAWSYLSCDILSDCWTPWDELDCDFFSGLSAYLEQKLCYVSVFLAKDTEMQPSREQKSWYIKEGKWLPEELRFKACLFIASWTTPNDPDPRSSTFSYFSWPFKGSSIKACGPSPSYAFLHAPKGSAKIFRQSWLICSYGPQAFLRITDQNAAHLPVSGKFNHVKSFDETLPHLRSIFLQNLSWFTSCHKSALSSEVRIMQDTITPRHVVWARMLCLWLVFQSHLQLDGTWGLCPCIEVI